MKVSYPAIFYEEKIGNYTVFFPDFQQVTCGDDLADAEFMAKDCLSLLITIEKEDRHKIPKRRPSKTWTCTASTPKIGNMYGLLSK